VLGQRVNKFILNQLCPTQMACWAKTCSHLASP